jgi:surface polysaccharide O-acyltransferase-like enzyme
MGSTNSMDNRLAWADNLRVAATIAVIVLHVTPNMLYENYSDSDNVWWISNVFTSICRFCVPSFVMLTGMLVISKEYEIVEYLRRKVIRIVVPLLFWSILYIMLNLSILYFTGVNLTLEVIFKSIFSQLRSGSSFHLWYVYMIIGIYLFLPIISKWIKNCNDREILYFLLVWFIAVTASQPFFIKYKTSIDFTYFSGYIGYAVLGYYLSIKSPDKKVVKNFLPQLLIFAGIGITFLGTYFLYKYKHGFRDYFYGYLSPNVILVSIGVFLLIKKRTINWGKGSTIINLISRYSYGIYLSHIMILYFMSKIGLGWKIMYAGLSIPILTIVCLFVSTIVVLLINRLPYGRYFAG